MNWVAIGILTRVIYIPRSPGTKTISMSCNIITNSSFPRISNSLHQGFQM